ncbi:MAG: cytochrome c1 [Alphaproteobacteria bacterium]|nr:cytochrome c1 [Alphaproteobacteria bacterium]
MRTIRTLFIAFAGVLAGAAAVWAAGEKIDIPERDWSWRGPVGSFERAELQRGLQVYTEVCASCHSLRLLAYRNLTALGYGEEEIKAYAANYEVKDGPDDQGEMFSRTAIPSDRFVPPFPNQQAARAANNGAYPPDLSLMTKARKRGPDYLFALLTGYEDEPPAGIELMAGMSYNRVYPGHQIAMPPPLFEGGVEYADGTEATVERMAADVTAFLAWAAEPELEQRKSMGIGVLVALGFLFVAVVLVKDRVWKDVKK